MNVTIRRRVGNTMVTPPAALRVLRYSRAAVGGCQAAVLAAEGSKQDLVELLDYLRHSVEIDQDGYVVWWGYVGRVEVEFDQVRITADLETMSNRVAVAYSRTSAGAADAGERGTTDWAEDRQSITEFGYKELLESLADTTANGAEDMRDRALAEYRYAQAGFEAQMGGLAQPRVTLYCYGWWSTMAWRYAPVPTNLALAYETYGLSEFDLGRATTAEEVYQSFGAGGGFDAKHVEIRARKVGTPSGGMTVSIYEDASGAPGTELASKTVAVADIPTSFDWVRFTFTIAATLSPAGTYWIGISRSGAAETGAYYEIEIDSAAGYGGNCLIDYDGTNMAASQDSAFRVYDTANTKQVYYETYDSTQIVARMTTIDQVAQAFDVSSAINLQDIEVYVAKVGTPTDSFQVAICENPDDLNPGTELASQAIFGSLLSTTPGWYRLTLSSPFALSAGTSYFLVLSRTGGTDPANYYQLVLDETQGYGGGPFVRKMSTWATYPADLPFRLFDNTLVETSQQAKAMITNFGQFLQMVRVENASGITTESYRDGDSTARYEVEKLLMIGTTNNRRLLTEVDRWRNVRIYEQPESTTSPYFVNSMGAIFDAFGNALPKYECPAGIWMVPKDMLPAAWTSTLTGLQAFFVEEMEYDVEQDTLSYQAANLPNPFDLGVGRG